jgi:hypothetical protein
MPEPHHASFGVLLGLIAVLGGVLWLGFGFDYVRRGLSPDGVDGLVFGGLAFFTGCVILYRRARTARSNQNEPDQAEPLSRPTDLKKKEHPGTD